MKSLFVIYLIFTFWDSGVRASRGRNQKNVYGNDLSICSTDPLTGWFRDGYARTDYWDRGLHTVCAVMTEEFLSYTRERGNDLSTPSGSFPGLRPGDKWALCAMRWLQAYNVGKAPLVDLNASNEAALRVVTIEQLQNRNVEGHNP